MIPRLQSGLVLGKFMPPHFGHLYLVGCALRQVKQLYVVVEHVKGEPMPSTLRVDWMRTLVPEAEIVHLDCPMPQDPDEHPNFWGMWREALRALLPALPEVVFASEKYGHRLAAELGARFLPVDPARQVVATSGTAIRAAPTASAYFLPDPVRAYYGLTPRLVVDAPRRVAFIGPESTGKTTCARETAERNKVFWVHEYAVTMMEAGLADSAALTLRDFEDFARGRLACEDTLASFGNALLCCDSDALTTQIYAEHVLGVCPPWIVQEAAKRKYDLTLLFAPDVSWQEDIHRMDREGRDAFFERMQEELQRAGRAYKIVSGAWAARREMVFAACEDLLHN